MQSDLNKQGACAGLALGLLSGVVMFQSFGCTAKPGRETTALEPRMTAYQQELHLAVDRIVHLAAHRDALLDEIEKIGARDLSNYETGTQCLQDVLETVQRRQRNMMESNYELEREVH